MNNTTEIPQGYMKNSVGHLVPEDMVQEHDKLRDKLVRDIVAKAKEANNVLKELKLDSFGDIETFVEMAAADYGVELGGKKGNLSLTSFDGRYKICRAVADNLVFDERLAAAKELIDECLTDWTADSGPEIKVLVNDAFKVDRQGNVNVHDILRLRRYAISDKRWQQAMLIIGESLTVAGSKSYIRVYERDEEDRWKMIHLDIVNA